MQFCRRLSVAAVVCLLAACTTEPERARAIGEAYVGPAKLPLRKELSQRSEVIAELQHGEKLEILGVRRRFVRVRNMGGGEGWLDSRNLLSASQVQRYAKLLETAKELPSQGRATVPDILNIHTEPNRQAPSPFQLPANGAAEVLAHTVTERAPYPSILPAILEKSKKKPARKPRSKPKAKEQQSSNDKDKDEVPPPPMPKAPAPPPQWEDLSRTTLTVPGAQPKLRDDWTLIRTPENHAGWVLTRMLSLSIPDEVAQYANGKRITAYFSLGEVQDEGQTKHHWLMATVDGPYRSHDFDAFRVFVYNTRKHRYEGGGGDREFRGYYPISRHTVSVTDNRRNVEAQGFTLITEDAAGNRWKRTYSFHSGRTRLISREAAPLPPPTAGDDVDMPSYMPTNIAAQESNSNSEQGSAHGLFTRIRNWFK